MSPDGRGEPAFTGVVDRPRLYDVLDLPSVRVCVIQGPSGAGKTTLLRSWAQRSGDAQVTVWVSVGPGITDRLAFWRHVLGVAVRNGGVTKEAAHEAEEQVNLAADPVRIAIGLLAGSRPVVLVLDSYEHLEGIQDEIDADLARLAAGAPDLRLMITTRGSTAMTDLSVADGAVRVIALGELEMTHDEIGALVLAQAGIDDPQLTRSVARATRGFPLTVRALVLAIAQLGRIPRLDSHEWAGMVGADLESLLPDAEAVSFVTDTAVAPYVDVDLAVALSGRADATDVLDMLERNGFGRWIPYAHQRPVFQYVETLRDTFRQRATRDVDRYRAACVTTARWLLANEELTDQALQFAIEGKDYGLADRVFVSLVITSPASYVTDRFLPVLREIPASALDRYPMLAFGLGLALMANPVERVRGPQAFRIAAESTSRPSYLEPSIDAFTHAAMRAIARRLMRSYQESVPATAEALRLCAQIEPESLERHSEHVGTILRQLSFSVWQGGDLPVALETIDRSVELCARPAPRNYSLVYAAAINAFAGDVARARVLIRAIAVEAWPEELRRTSMNGLGMLAEALLALDAFDFTSAAAALSDSVPFMQTNEYWPFITTARVMTAIGNGHAAAEAERVGRDLETATPPPGAGDNIATECLAAQVAHAWLAAGEPAKAAAVLEVQRADSPHLAGARLSLLLATEGSEALGAAHALLALPGHTHRTRAETHTFAAAAALRGDHLEQAWNWLSAATVAWDTYGPRAHVMQLDARDRAALMRFSRERQAVRSQQYLDAPEVHAHGSIITGADLTPRERVVLAMLPEHAGSRGIAEALVVSPHTVKSQLRSIYRKLGVSSRASAVTVARRLGLLEEREPVDS